MRTRVLAVALFSVATLTVGSAQAAGDGTGRFDRPQDGFAPAGTVLREGPPESVGLSRKPIDAALGRIAAWTEKTPDLEHPMYAGAVSLLAHDGVVVSKEAVGHEVRYADGKGTELPPGEQEKANTDTIFDVASISKLFTSIAALQQAEDGQIDLSAPVAEYLPEFGVNGKESITVEQLLTHTSGLQAEAKLWKLPPKKRIPHIMNLTPENAPGTTYQYSDPNMITLGVLIERVAGKSLDKVVSERITQPLSMRDTGYNPPKSKLHRIAATEFQAEDPARGMVRGEVHDENAWSLGGVAGQAGVFSTADDLAILGQTILNGGTYQGTRILDRNSVEKMLTNYNEQFPEDSHGLGFELDQRWYMAGLSSPRTAGHTGYTGPSLVLDPDSRSMAVLMANRVHPSREWGSNNVARATLAQGLAESLAVRPARGPKSWFAEASEPASLRTDDLGKVRGKARVDFQAFVDTQADSDARDALTVESSVDGGKTWQPVRLTASGEGSPDKPVESLAGAGHRAWWQVSGDVPAKPGEKVQVRWNYAPDEEYVGRGVHLDDISVSDDSGKLLDGERHPDRLHAEGWTQTRR